MTVHIVGLEVQVRLNVVVGIGKKVQAEGSLRCPEVVVEPTEDSEREPKAKTYPDAQTRLGSTAEEKSDLPGCQEETAGSWGNHPIRPCC